MGRTLAGNMPTILAGVKRSIDWTLDIVLPDAQEFHFATSPIAALNGKDYENYLEKVGQIRQTLENPTDLVNVAIQNKDGELGRHVATYYKEWRRAEAVIGRLYYQVNVANERTGVTQWMEMFRGAVQQPLPEDLYITFDIIPDTTSPGQIVCTRTLAPNCGFVYGDPKTCAKAGTLTSCNHHLKSTGGCDGNDNFEHYGGTENRSQPTVAVPGTGGNEPPEPQGPPCPRKDQYVRVRGANGKVIAIRAAKLTTDDWLWHPILRRFYRVAAAERVKDQPIWETRGVRGILGFSSQRHPIIRDASDDTGTAVEEMRKGDHFMTETEGCFLEAVMCKAARDTGFRDDVVRITMDAPTMAEKIYAYSDSITGPFIVCHNAKQNPL